MNPKLALALTLGATGILVAGVSGCSANAQTGPQVQHVALATTPVLPSATLAMPAPQAPFDETEITPTETVGAARSD